MMRGDSSERSEDAMLLINKPYSHNLHVDSIQLHHESNESIGDLWLLVQDAASLLWFRFLQAILDRGTW